jgi:hypothetical protein
VIGAFILLLYGIVTTIAGMMTFRRREGVGLSSLQIAVLLAMGIAVMVIALLSISNVIGWFWLIIVCIAAVLSRVWNGLTMGRVHPSHIVLFGGVLTSGVILTHIR